MGVFVGNGVYVGRGVFVGNGGGAGVTGVETSEHPNNKADNNTNTKKADRIDIFINISPFNLITRYNHPT
jgi:hypothetical protein